MKTIKKLSLHNFQSHADTTLEFVPGVNALVGSSDEGKSSIIRALGAVLQNDVSNSYVRHGTDFFEVTVVFDDGNEITRLKGPKVNSYIVNQETFERLGDDVPEKVRRAIGSTGVWIDDYFVPVSLSKQGAEPFLLSESAPVRAKLLGMISGLDLIDKALREMQKDGNQLDKEMKVTEGIWQEQDKECQKLDGEMAAHEPIYKELDWRRTAYESKVNKYQLWLSVRDSIAKIDDDMAAHRAGMTTHKTIMDAVSFDRILDLYKQWDRLTKTLDSYSQIQETIRHTTVALKEASIDFDATKATLDELRERVQLKERLDKAWSDRRLLNKEIADCEYSIERENEKLDKAHKEMEALRVCPFCYAELSAVKMKELVARL